MMQFLVFWVICIWYTNVETEWCMSESHFLHASSSRPAFPRGSHCDSGVLVCIRNTWKDLRSVYHLLISSQCSAWEVGSGTCARALCFTPVGRVLLGVYQTISGHAYLVFPSVKILLYIYSMSLDVCNGARVRVSCRIAGSLGVYSLYLDSTYVDYGQ